jgi:hypothetical protein
MAISPERKARINPDIDPAIRQNPVDLATPDINVTQTGLPPQASASPAGGYLIAAIVILLGFVLAIYFGSRSDTTAPSITQNSTTEMAPEATPPATPPAATTEPAQPAQPEATTQQPATGTGTSGTSTEQ